MHSLRCLSTKWQEANDTKCNTDTASTWKLHKQVNKLAAASEETWWFSSLLLRAGIKLNWQLTFGFQFTASVNLTSIFFFFLLLLFPLSKTLASQPPKWPPSHDKNDTFSLKRERVKPSARRFSTFLALCGRRYVLLRNRRGRGELRPRWRRLQTSTTTSTVTLDTHEATLPPRGARAHTAVCGNLELIAFIVFGFFRHLPQTNTTAQRKKNLGEE